MRVCAQAPSAQPLATAPAIVARVDTTPLPSVPVPPPSAPPLSDAALAIPPSVTSSVIAATSAVATAVAAAMAAAAHASSAVTSAAVSAAVQSGARKAALLHAEDAWVLPEGASAWAGKHAAREAEWMRPQLWQHVSKLGNTSEPFKGVCSSTGVYTKRLAPDLIRRRGGSSLAAETRCRPRIQDYVTHGRSLHVINFSTAAATKVLQEHGKGSVPCGNPGCCGSGCGVWDTTPLEYSRKATLPSVAADGLPDAAIAMRSQCNSCGTSFRHDDCVTLERLRDVPELLRDLPFDPSFKHGNVCMLHRSITTNLQFDVISKQGFATAIEKLKILSAESSQRSMNECVLRIPTHGDALVCAALAAATLPTACTTAARAAARAAALAAAALAAALTAAALAAALRGNFVVVPGAPPGRRRQAPDMLPSCAPDVNATPLSPLPPSPPPASPPPSPIAAALAMLPADRLYIWLMAALSLSAALSLPCPLSPMVIVALLRCFCFA
jgi:hypothetical protein